MGRKITFCLSVLLLVSGLALFFWPEKPEPLYNGKKLSEWLIAPHKAIRWRGGDWPVETTNAISAIGTNGIPFYLEWLAYEPGPFARAEIQTARKGRDWFHLPWRPQDRKALRAGGAVFAFSVLGQKGEGAIPQLITYAKDRNAPSRRNSAISSLGFIGDAAFPALVTLATNQNHDIRIKAMEVIASLGFNKPGVEHLNLLLQHSDPAIRNDSLTVLQWLVVITPLQ